MSGQSAVHCEVRIEWPDVKTPAVTGVGPPEWALFQGSELILLLGSDAGRKKKENGRGGDFTPSRCLALSTFSLASSDSVQLPYSSSNQIHCLSCHC